LKHHDHRFARCRRSFWGGIQAGEYWYHLPGIRVITLIV
jgi:hypothetical protein